MGMEAWLFSTEKENLDCEISVPAPSCLQRRWSGGGQSVKGEVSL